LVGVSAIIHLELRVCKQKKVSIIKSIVDKRKI